MNSNTVQLSLPSEGSATSTSVALDLNSFRFRVNPAVRVVPAQIRCEPLPTLPTGESITLKAQDSADGSTFADLDGVSLTISGPKPQPTEGPFVRLPPSTRRFVRLHASSSAGAGNRSTISATLSLPQVGTLN